MKSCDIMSLKLLKGHSWVTLKHSTSDLEDRLLKLEEAIRRPAALGKFDSLVDSTPSTHVTDM